MTRSRKPPEDNSPEDHGTPTYASSGVKERLLNLTLLLTNARMPLTMEYITTQVPGYPPGRDARRQAFDRDREILAEGGIAIKTVPLYEDHSQWGYSIENDYLDGLDFTADEHLVLNMVLAASRFQRGSYMSPSLAHFFVSMPTGNLLEQIYRSAIGNYPITFHYRGSPRKVLPRMLRFVAGRWYLLSWDLDRDAWRTYRIDRIDGDVIKTSEASSDYHIPLLESEWADSIWTLGGSQSVRVEVLVDYPLASEIEADLGSGRVKSSDRRGVVFALDATNLEALYSWVLSLGDHAEILSPPEVREAMIERLKSIIRGNPRRDPHGDPLYGSSSNAPDDGPSHSYPDGPNDDSSPSPSDPPNDLPYSSSNSSYYDRIEESKEDRK